MLKKFFDHKIWALLAAGLAVVILVILAAGLENIQFQPGRPLAQGESATIEISVGKIAEQIVDIPFWKQLVFLGLVFILVIIVASLFSPELRKRIILFFLRFTLFVLALFLILRISPPSFKALELGGTTSSEGTLSPGVESAPAVFTPPHLSATLLYLLSLGIVVVLAAVAFLTGRWWLRKQRLQKASQPLEGLAEIARSSLADISAGRAWEDVIIKCYARMSEVADTKRGLQRRSDLTASEFAARLEGAGLPGEAVIRLTRLFEAARYGARQASRQEMVEAVACLSTILHACGVNK